MTKRIRQEIEGDKTKSKKYIETGAKALGRARNLDVIIEILLDIRDEMAEIKAKIIGGFSYG